MYRHCRDDASERSGLRARDEADIEEGEGLRCRGMAPRGVDDSAIPTAQECHARIDARSDMTDDRDMVEMGEGSTPHAV